MLKLDLTKELLQNTFFDVSLVFSSVITGCAPIVVAIAFSIVRFAMLWGDTGLNVAKGDAVEVLDCPPDVSVASLTGLIVSDVPSVVQDLTELEVELPLAAAEDEEPEWLRKNKQYVDQSTVEKVGTAHVTVEVLEARQLIVQHRWAGGSDPYVVVKLILFQWVAFFFDTHCIRIP